MEPTAGKAVVTAVEHTAEPSAEHTVEPSAESVVRIELPYLGRLLPLKVADENLMAIVEPNETGIHADSAGILRQALENPSGSPGTSLTGFLGGASSVLEIGRAHV